MKTGKYLILLRFLLIFMLALSSLCAMPDEVFGEETGFHYQKCFQQDLHDTTDTEGFNVVDCPEGTDDYSYYRVVLQIIDDTFHKWREYELNDEEAFFIFMEEPHRGALTAEEARELLLASQEWKTQILPLKEATTVDPEDLPELKCLMPYIDETLPDRTGEHIIEEPDASISRSDYLDTMDKSAVDNDDSIAQAEIEIAPHNVHGSDERVRVSYSNTTAYPANTVGYLESNFGLFWGTRGTGFLISPHTVLTNAHNLYNSELGGWYSELSFYPGQFQAYEGDRIYRPYDAQNAVNAEIPTGYIVNEGNIQENIPYDYGAVFIETPFSAIDTFMPVEFNHHPLYINLFGYPREVQGESNSMAMWHSFGEVVNVLSRELYYLADATGGNSGGPAFVYDRQTDISRVVGLIAAGGPSFNAGPRLADHNKALIEEWMLWEPEGIYDVYFLTVEVIGKGITEPSEGVHEYKAGEAIALSASPAEGWKFDKWVVNGTEYAEPDITITMDTDKTATAHFIEEVEDEEGWEMLPTMHDVSLDKAWAIQFNRAFEANEIDGIVIEKNNDFIPVTVQVKTEDRQAIVTPINPYQPGSSYNLRIFLNNLNRYKMYFNTEEEQG